jgi:hypothetical protein
MGEKSKHISITPKHTVENRNHSPAFLCGSKMLEMTCPRGAGGFVASGSKAGFSYFPAARRNGGDAGIDN